MKIIQTNEHIERSNSGVESHFTIKATSRSFDILSSLLYSDKPAAIVRELACNAYDSHVAAGKKDVPIEICLPSILSPTFYVKDFGTGLSDVEMRGGMKHIVSGEEFSLEQLDTIDQQTLSMCKSVKGIYNTYFESTKTGSDDYIGQLGLGSKSPFAYASTFNVESCHNGQKSIYTCYKDEQGLPAIVRLYSETTQDPNGLTVTLSVRTGDIGKFHAAAQSKLMYFSPTPTIVGVPDFKPHRLSHTIRGLSWAIRETDYYAHMSGAYVVQGFVAYPVDRERLIEGGLDLVAAELACTDVDMYIQIGTVEVAASREALSYVDRTVANLNAAFRTAASEIRDSFQAEFDACATRYDACTLVDTFLNTGTSSFKRLFGKMHTAKPFTFAGVAVVSMITLDMTDITNIKMFTAIADGSLLKMSNKYKESYITKYDFYFLVNRYVIVDLRSSGNSSIICQYLKNKTAVGSRGNSALVIRATSNKEAVQALAAAKKICEMLGNATLIRVDEMGIYNTTAPRQSTKGLYLRRSKVNKLVWDKLDFIYTGYGRSKGRFTRKSWVVKPIDMQAGGFYVSVFNYEALGPTSSSMYALPDIIKHAIYLNLIPADVVVVGLSETEQVGIDKTKWFDLYDYVKQAYTAMHLSYETTGRKAFNDILYELGSYVRHNLVEKYNDIDCKLNDGLFKKIIHKIAVMNETPDPPNLQAFESLAETYGIASKSLSCVNDILREWNELSTVYPMFKCVNWRALNEYELVDTIIQYVNSVDVVNSVQIQDSINNNNNEA